MSRQDANAAFALSSFLYGGNAAYIEDLHARYEADPASVDAEWQAFFGSLKDGADATKSLADFRGRVIAFGGRTLYIDRRDACELDSDCNTASTDDPLGWAYC